MRIWHVVMEDLVVRTYGVIFISIMVDVDFLKKVVGVLEASADNFDTENGDIRSIAQVLEYVRNRSIEFRDQYLKHKLSYFVAEFKILLDFSRLREQIALFKELAEIDEYYCSEIPYVYQTLMTFQRKAITMNDYTEAEIYGVGVKS